MTLEWFVETRCMDPVTVLAPPQNVMATVIDFTTFFVLAYYTRKIKNPKLIMLGKITTPRGVPYRHCRVPQYDTRHILGGYLFNWIKSYLYNVCACGIDVPQIADKIGNIKNPFILVRTALGSNGIIEVAFGIH